LAGFVPGFSVHALAERPEVLVLVRSAASPGSVTRKLTSAGAAWV
jgi:hypothetical protein